MTGKIHLSLVRKTNLVCQSLVHLAQTEVCTLKKNNRMEKWYEFLRYLNVELKVDVTFIIILQETGKSLMLKLLGMITTCVETILLICQTFMMSY